MRYQYKLFLLFITFFMLLGCGDGLESEGTKESAPDSNKEEKELSEEEKFKRDSIRLVERKKELIIKFYDSIGYKMIDLILKNRVYETNPDQRPNVKDIGLNNFNSKLKEEAVKSYAKSLIKHRDILLSNLIEDTIYKRLDTILISRFYVDTIVGEDKDGKDRGSIDLYVKLHDEIQASIDTLKNNIEVLDLKDDQKPHENQVKEGNAKTALSQDSVEDNTIPLIESIKSQGILFLILFLASIVFNIIQYIIYRKKSKQRNGELSQAKDKLTSNETKQGKNSDDSFKPKPSQLSAHIVRNKIESAYQTMRKTLLQRYHRDCVGVQEVTYNTLLSDTLTEAQSKRFTSEQELASYISNPLDKHRMLLESDIKECIPQDLAIQQIHTSVTAESFLSRINTAIIPESDVRSKVQSLKQNLIDELPLTTTQEVLSGIIQDYKINIETHLTKMLQENLVFYFPFADVRGALSDEKKSKTKARDSALQLLLSPDDITKAAFHLLLDQEQMMQAGIMSYDSLLLPICELKPENFNSSGTRIEEIGTQGGKMVLEDGKWRVKDKLPIKII
ncbi:hypothetical protein ACFO3O_06705 [Dokdonia ponticola]|uniref:Uncharacterized protein n=1 Tax=Dokdonia ponticola TaxID=2041041 RepID=A0ABV9HX48_9FLAO